MASATKKIEASPFLIRRVNVLEKLKENKEWLEESYQKVKNFDTDSGEKIVGGREVVAWMEANWDAVLKHLKDTHYDGLLKFNWHYHTDYSDPTSTMEVSINLNKIEGYPYRRSETNTNIIKLNYAVKQAFMSCSDNKGIPIPSRYQKICEYIALFDQSDQEFIDAKFYSDLPSLISNFKDQFNTVQQID